MASLFINLASVLHVVDISPPLDANGRPIVIVPEATDGLVSCVLYPVLSFAHIMGVCSASCPVDCRCSIKPRSAEAKAWPTNQATDIQSYGHTIVCSVQLSPYLPLTVIVRWI